jgi:O-acetyl-ADP-ribose deacetylase (regulator of RNase III)
MQPATCCCTLPANHDPAEEAFCARTEFRKLTSLITDVLNGVTDAQLRLQVVESVLSKLPSASASTPLYSQVAIGNSNIPPAAPKHAATVSDAPDAANGARAPNLQRQTAPKTRATQLPPTRDMHKTSRSQLPPTRDMQTPSPSPPPTPRLHEIEGDLFDDAPPSASLAHCVGADFRMGKGVAVEFRKRFGEHELLQNLQLRPGQVACRPQHDKATGRVARFVFHLVTKPRSANCLPRPAEFRGSVRTLAKECVKRRIHTIAMPQIGAGLDRQPWKWARKVIMQEFSGIDIDILVFLRPSEGPKRKHWQSKKPAGKFNPKKSPTARLTSDLEKMETSTHSSNPTSVGAAEAAQNIPTPQSTPTQKVDDVEGREGGSQQLNSVSPTANPLLESVELEEKENFSTPSKPLDENLDENLDVFLLGSEPPPRTEVPTPVRNLIRCEKPNYTTPEFTRLIQNIKPP